MFKLNQQKNNHCVSLESGKLAALGLVALSSFWGGETVSAQEVVVDDAMAEMTAVSELRDRKSGDILPEANILLQDSEDPLAQIGAVSQLRDVNPGDWAAEALRNLVEKYSCVAGYPDGTYRGDRSLSRYEFAAGLNACLQQMERLISQGDFVPKEDLEALKRLMEEFEQELMALGARIDSLDSQVSFLEDNQFSTTVKLNGFITLGTQANFAGGDGQVLLQQQTFLNLSTSFRGLDLLSLSLLAQNTTPPTFATTNNGRTVGATNEGFSTTQFAGSTNNNVIMFLEYVTPIFGNPNGGGFLTFLGNSGFNTARYLLRRGALSWEGYAVNSGPLSTFAQRSPLYRLGGGQGVIAAYANKTWQFAVGYLAAEGNGGGASGTGLFHGDAMLGAHIDYTAPGSKFAVAIDYTNNYFGAGRFAYNNQFTAGPDSLGFVGTALANRFDNQGVFFDQNIPVNSNSYGIQAFYQFSPKFVVGGFAAKTAARLLGRGDADIWTYALQLQFPDLGKQGNIGGLIIGMEPTLTGLTVGGVPRGDFQRDTSLHIEAFYQHRINDNIAITPGLIWITAPNQDTSNKDVLVGMIRTTFAF